MPKITRKDFYNIDSEQIEKAYTNTMFDVAKNLQDSIVLQITEDFIYKILKNMDYQVTKSTQMLTSKRILIDDVSRYVIPNWYSMVFVSKI